MDMLISEHSSREQLRLPINNKINKLSDRAAKNLILGLTLKS